MVAVAEKMGFGLATSRGPKYGEAIRVILVAIFLLMKCSAKLYHTLEGYTFL